VEDHNRNEGTPANQTIELGLVTMMSMLKTDVGLTHIDEILGNNYRVYHYKDQ
jgi:hypothetical protein